MLHAHPSAPRAGLRLITSLLALCIGVAAPPISCAEEVSIFAGGDQGPGGEALRSGWSALMDQGDPKKALEHFKSLAGQEDAPAFALISMGMAEMERGRYDAAAGWLLNGLAKPGWGPWQEVALADLAELLDDVKDPEGIADVLRKRVSDSAVPVATRGLMRHTLSELERHRSNSNEAVAILEGEPYLSSYMVIGPFANRDGGQFEQPHEIESVSLKDALSKTFPGRGREVTWQALMAAPDGRLDLGASLHPGQEVFAYALALIKSETEQDATLRLGAGGACAAWVNGKAVARNDDYYSYHPFQRRIGIRLRKGVNAILVKVGGDRDSQCVFSAAVIPGTPEALEQPGSFDPARAALKTLTVFDAKDRVAFTGALADVPSASQPTTNNADADALRDAGANWGAAGFLERILKDDPDNSLALVTRGYLRILRGMDDMKWSRVRPLLDNAVEASPRSPLALELAAMVHPDENEARALLERAVAASSENFAARELLMDQYHRGGFQREAEGRAKEILKAYPSAYAWRVIGGVNESRGWNAEARAAYEKAIGIAPSWPDPVINLYNSLQSDTEAIGTLYEGMKTAASPEIRALLAERLGKKQDFQAAADLYRDALSLNPFDLASWSALADCARAQGNLEEERQTLEEALTRLPQSPELMERLGRRLLEADDKNAGIHWLRESLAIKSDNPILARYLKAMEPKRELWFASVDISFEELDGKDATPDDYPRHNVIGLLDQAYSWANPNGTKRQMIHSVQKVLRRNGIRQASQHGIAFDPGRQNVEIIRARVYQPDGSVLENADVKDRSYRGGVGGGVYSQYAQKIVTLPQVREGSIVELQYTVEDTDDNLYTDDFEDGFFFGGTSPTLRFEYTANVPLEMEVRHDQAHTDLRATITEKDGRRIIRWRAENLPGIEVEPMMPPIGDLVPSLRVSTFRDWNDVGEWYWTLSKQQMELPDDIKAEIAEIIAEADTREARIEAIYDWLIQNIRYVSISFGLFGCKPHEAERTWRTRYGDCKDTAVLFCSMLREAGIDAKVALVRTYDLGKEPTGVPGARLFNHAIAYVPPEKEGGEHYWLDGTTDYYVFGEVPLMDRGGMALITGPEGGKLVTVDKASADLTVVRQEVEISLRHGGGGAIRREERMFGEIAPTMRRAADTPERMRTALSMMAASRFSGAKLDDFGIEPAEPEPPVPTPGMTLRMGFDSPRLAQPAGEVMRMKPVMLPGQLSARYATQRERTHDLMLGLPLTREAAIRINLPEGASVVSIPEDVEVTHPFASYERTSVEEEGGIRIVSRLTLSARRLAAKDYPAFRQFCHKVDSAEEEWVVYQEDPNAEPEEKKEVEPESVPIIQDRAGEEIAD